ncbi:acyl-CoA dehydrogenase family protein [Mycobacterium sp. M26]|uniref:acyl-CoA dehydrogenase family protein n=1 Tax=Mycobacterium sp. M26 TaxID=1762962 RepID=UPI00073E4C01|nr:acyl-CoA dehydrogenase family protein [Mycobacterium sp. M26]
MSELDDLREMVRDLLDDRASSEDVRAVLGSAAGYDARLWQTVADLDLLGLLVPDEFGGVGAGLAEMSVVLHELGRRAVPLPVISSAVLAPVALLGGANPALAAELLPALATGAHRAAVIVGGPQGQPDPATWTLTAAPHDGGYILDGAAGFVLDAPGADHLVVGARTADGVIVVVADAADATVTAVPGTDQTRCLATVTFTDTALPEERVLATGAQAASLIARVQTVAAYAIACDAVGLAERTMEQTADYAKVRQQFGRPIGSFQAIKHMCANMAVAVETSRAGLGLALAELSRESGEGPVSAVSTAKAYACDAAVKVCTDAVQAHGGIGFTWEHDAHLWLKRALLDRALFGSPSWHRRRVADAVLPARTGA